MAAVTRACVAKHRDHAAIARERAHEVAARRD